MGFYIRKSLTFGPLRLNLSKRGIGVSTGVKGLRISQGPRGTELYAGRSGVYYRQKLSGQTTNENLPPVQSTASSIVVLIGVGAVILVVVLIAFALLAW